MKCTVHSHHLYKCVVASNRRTRPREGACWPIHTMNLRYMAVINRSQIRDSWPYSVEILFTDHVVLYYTKGLCYPLSGVCHITGRRRKGKGLVAPFRYNYYCGPTKDPALIRDPAFIFVIMLFPLASKQDQAFIRDFKAIQYLNKLLN